MRINSKYRLYNIAGEKVVILPGKPDEYNTYVISFNTTSEWLWNQLIDKEFTTQYVADLLINRFLLEPEIARKDAEVWICQLKENLIIED